jgi:peptidoglycan lytic transglycosylase
LTLVISSSWFGSVWKITSYTLNCTPSTSAPFGSYRRVYRCTVCLGMLVLLAACSGKHVPVSHPARANPAARTSELEGLASYYAEPYHGRRTASGEVFDTYKAMTAAHRTLPFNTVVRVQNTTNGKAVEVRINDRGPFIAGRIIDLSVRAARAIDMLRPGVVLVKLQILSQGAVPRRTACGEPRDAIQDGALEPLCAADDLVVSLDRVDERATQ